jgi:hypothetical protein
MQRRCSCYYAWPVLVSWTWCDFAQWTQRSFMDWQRMPCSELVVRLRLDFSRYPPANGLSLSERTMLMICTYFGYCFNSELCSPNDDHSRTLLLLSVASLKPLLSAILLLGLCIVWMCCRRFGVLAKLSTGTTLPLICVCVWVVLII